MGSDNPLPVHFTLHGAFIPYVRMTQRSKHVDERARAYIASQGVLKYQIKEQLHDAGLELIVLPARTPFSLLAQITMAGGLQKSDLDNQLKALLDAAQGIVFVDDRWCNSIQATRLLGDEDLCQLWFHLLPGGTK